jgi:hypothetical protein
MVEAARSLRFAPNDSSSMGTESIGSVYQERRDDDTDVRLSDNIQTVDVDI